MFNSIAIAVVLIAVGKSIGFQSQYLSTTQPAFPANENEAIYWMDNGEPVWNVTRTKTLAQPHKWTLLKPTLDFPKTPPEDQFKMAQLLAENQLLSADFLHHFLTAIQPYDIQLDS
uniref:PyrG_1 protein n=1 Tax=Fopius arisanus TaxID=64838 RepID=A0A0C9PR86_9HYME